MALFDVTKYEIPDPKNVDIEKPNIMWESSWLPIYLQEVE